MNHYNHDNPFAKIISDEIEANIIYQDKDILAFNDIAPVSPVHILVIPKEPYVNFADFIANKAPSDIGGFFNKIPKIAEMAGLKEYRVITNNGAESGQTVFHFHVHIIGGKKISNLI